MEIVAELKESAWMEFLARTPGSNIFQSPHMARVYEATKGYRPHLVAAEFRGEIRALMASVLVDYASGRWTRLTGRAIVTGGPLGDAHAFPHLLAAHDGTAQREALLSQIRNLEAPRDPTPFLSAGYRWEDHVNFTIDLSKGESAILERMSKARRKGIQRADRAGLEIRDLRRDDLDEAYALVRDTYTRASIPLADASLFRNAYEILGREGCLWAIAAVVQGTARAVRFVLRWEGVLYDWYAGSSDEGRNLHADEWLVWQVLTRGIARGCSTFDFGGAGRPGEPYGPREFKRRFGGREVNPGRFEKVYRPFATRATRVALEVWRKLA